MTAALAFDTLQYSKRLQQAGVAAPVADAQAEALAQVLTTGMDALATRADLERVSLAARTDLERVETSLKGDIHALENRLISTEGQLRSEFRSELRLLEQRMTIKLGSMLVVAVGVMAVLDKLL
ncbi:CCDC90 family protein [Pigmentiphaga sp. GD03639]|uniref:hypothetical protein n=1 Tax=Pigmentiphaga sp. GD03639 TaxID=2975354 RepID=UPI002447E42A|nr:hypothetical protein [Pigmentiphaga sp. GD03639]MDH2240091.1 CCDC90 family protein [Pigmentiphaga sp. GD03639]